MTGLDSIAFKPRSTLGRALAPQSVAVVGASNRPGSFGSRTLDNLKSYPGRLWLVSRTSAVLEQGLTYATLSDLPEVPDCVVLAMPGEQAASQLNDCAALGVGGVILYASGFGEVGDFSRQQALSDIARRGGLALFGPNCLGIANHTMETVLSFADFTGGMGRVAKGIGVISQSGAVGIALSQIRRRGVPISHVLTFGNGCDVDTADLIAYLAEEPSCSAIACVFEGSSEPLRIVRAVRFASECGKVVVMYKVAKGEEGARAAMSHTGSLAGSDSIYRAVFRDAGAVLVDSLEALIETTSFFAKAPPPLAAGVAIVSTSGGIGIMCADKAEENKISLPQPSEETLNILRQHIPSYGSSRNPCDLPAPVLSNPDSLSACCDAFANDRQYGALVTSQSWAAPTLATRVKVYEETAIRSGKPVCTVWVSQWHEGPGAMEFEASPHVALFHSVANCFGAIRAWYEHHAWTQMRHRFPHFSLDIKDRALALLRSSLYTSLGEREAKQLLELYGVRIVSDHLVTSADQAADVAETIGFPVVMKIDSPDIFHKTDIGGVQLGVNSRAQAVQSYLSIMASVAATSPTARIKGVLVQPMIKPGLEVIVGSRLDPQFGSILMIGLGGIFVELLTDVALSPVPVSCDTALALLQGLRGAKLFDGLRGSHKIDLERLADTVSRISRMVADLGQELLELDVNPIICSQDGHIYAVDALCVRHVIGSSVATRGEHEMA